MNFILKKRVRNLIEKRGVWILLCSLFLSIVYSLFSSVDSKPKTSHLNPKTVDTFIPKGYVLIPLEIENKESLNSILGRFGVVDLYEVSENKTPSLLAASIRIIRSPNNPDVWAVMTHERKASTIIKAKGLIKVVLQNPGSIQTRYVAPVLPKIKRKIHIYSSPPKESSL